MTSPEITKIIELLQKSIRKQLEPSLKDKLNSLTVECEYVMQQLQQQFNTQVTTDDRITENQVQQWYAMINRCSSLDKSMGRASSRAETQPFFANVLTYLSEIHRLVKKLDIQSASAGAISVTEPYQGQVQRPQAVYKAQLDSRSAAGGPTLQMSSSDLDFNDNIATTRYRNTMDGLDKQNDRLLPQSQMSALDLEKSGKEFKDDGTGDVWFYGMTISTLTALILAVVVIGTCSYFSVYRTEETNVAISKLTKNAVCWIKEKIGTPCEVITEKPKSIINVLYTNFIESFRKISPVSTKRR